tara:strand:- start:766 stop:1635 length:870 start_codon:yes stop_codon:yes gene_type:complete
MEIIVKINDGPSPTSYKDGDVVRAVSMSDIYYCHAQHKCHVTNFGFTTGGMRIADPLLIKFLEKTRVYKFERLNSNDVKRTNLITSEEGVFNNTPNDDGERIDVQQYVSRLIRDDKHLVFMSNGLECWYGKNRVDIDVDSIWSDIETHTDFLQSDHIHFPLADIEKRRLLPMSCCMHGHSHDHTDLPAHNACLDCTCGCALSECDVDLVSDRSSSVVSIINEGTEEEYNEILHKRKYQVPYWDLTSTLSLDIDSIRNTNEEVDLRKPLQERSAVDLLTVDKIAAGIVSV